MTTAEMVELYGRGHSMREIGDMAGLSQKTVAKRLDAAGMERRSMSESVRLAFTRSRKPRTFARLAQTRVNVTLDGSYVEAAPPAGSEELYVVHNVSAAEKMLVLRMAAQLRENERQNEKARRKRPGSDRRWRFKKGRPLGDRQPESSPCEKILAEAGVKSSRRQYHLMTCAVALAKESGVIFAGRQQPKAQESA